MHAPAASGRYGAATNTIKPGSLNTSAISSAARSAITMSAA